MEISPVIFWNIILTLVIAPAFWTFRGLITEVKRIDILVNKTEASLLLENNSSETTTPAVCASASIKITPGTIG